MSHDELFARFVFFGFMALVAWVMGAPSHFSPYYGYRRTRFESTMILAALGMGVISALFLIAWTVAR